MRIVVTLIIALFTSLASLLAHAEERSNYFGPDANAALGAYRGMVEEHAEGIVRELPIIAGTSE
jgi:hypothetical protein